MQVNEPEIITWHNLKKLVKKVPKKKFSSVRYLLKAWHQRDKNLTGDAKRKALLHISDACIGLLGLQGEQKLSPDRQQAMRRVISDVFHSIAFHDYFKNKAATGGPSPQAMGLSGGYAHERKNFEKKNKASSPEGASWLTDSLNFVKKGSADADIKQAKTSFDTLSYAQYVELHRKLGGMVTRQSLCNQVVHFARREERIRDLMLVPVSGKLYDTNGKLPNGMYLYAMDRFGSLFGARLGRRNPPDENLNHSTLCAGRPVICAGEFDFKSGEITFATGNSGHYKPDAARLLAAFDILIDEYGLKLDQTLTEIDLQGDKFKTDATSSALKKFRQRVTSKKQVAAST